MVQLRRPRTIKPFSKLSVTQCLKVSSYLLIVTYVTYIILSFSPTKNIINLGAVGAPPISSHDTQLGASQSYGFFDDVPLKSWNLLRDIYMQVDNHREPDRPLLFSDYDPPFPDDYDPGYRSAHAWWGNNYEPNFSCQFEKRIGGNGDGPKWVG